MYGLANAEKVQIGFTNPGDSNQYIFDPISLSNQWSTFVVTSVNPISSLMINFINAGAFTIGGITHTRVLYAYYSNVTYNGIVLQDFGSDIGGPAYDALVYQGDSAAVGFLGEISRGHIEIGGQYFYNFMGQYFYNFNSGYSINYQGTLPWRNQLFPGRYLASNNGLYSLYITADGLDCAVYAAGTVVNHIMPPSFTVSNPVFPSGTVSSIPVTNMVGYQNAFNTWAIALGQLNWAAGTTGMQRSILALQQTLESQTLLTVKENQILYLAPDFTGGIGFGVYQNGTYSYLPSDNVANPGLYDLYLDDNGQVYLASSYDLTVSGWSSGTNNTLNPIWGPQAILGANLSTIYNTYNQNVSSQINSTWGSGVTIYLLDSGVTDNPVTLNALNPTQQAFSYMNVSASTPMGANGTNQTTYFRHTNYNDYSGHGTESRMIIKNKFFGLAQSATIKSIKINSLMEGVPNYPLGEYGYDATLIQAFQMIQQDHTPGPKIVNLPISMVNDNQAPQPYILCGIQWLYQSGIYVVMAAGNEGGATTKDPTLTGYKDFFVSRYAFVVGGVVYRNTNNSTQAQVYHFFDQTNNLTVGTNGGAVDVWAPWEFASASYGGTSISTAYVTSALAALLSMNPVGFNSKLPGFAYKWLLDNAQTKFVALPPSSANITSFAGTKFVSLANLTTNYKNIPTQSYMGGGDDCQAISTALNGSVVDWTTLFKNYVPNTSSAYSLVIGRANSGAVTGNGIGAITCPPCNTGDTPSPGCSCPY
jgi:hypothetical protein